MPCTAQPMSKKDIIGAVKEVMTGEYLKRLITELVDDGSLDLDDIVRTAMNDHAGDFISDNDLVDNSEAENIAESVVDNALDDRLEEKVRDLLEGANITLS